MSSLPPLFNTDGQSTCPLGFPMNQNRLAVPMWSYAMEKVPPARILELGSYNAGFTTALAVHAWMLDCEVITYDRMQAPSEDFRPLSEFLGVVCRKVDLYAPETVEEIKSLIRKPGITYLLCDGGNKMLEVNTYAPVMKSGDVIAGHDYCCGNPDWWPWTELKKDDVADAVAAAQLEPFFQEHFDMAGWLAYRKP